MKYSESMPFDISHIAGNASEEIKQTIGNPAYFFANRRPDDITSPIFGESIQRRLKVTEISIKKKEEEERKLEARMVFEMDVTEGEWEFIEWLLEMLDDRYRYAQWGREYSWWLFRLPGGPVGRLTSLRESRISM